MPTATTDPSAVEREVSLLAGKLLREIGSGRALAQLRTEALLDRDLGIGSLERVELVVRIEEAFRVELPEGAAASARTLADLVRAVEAALASPAAGPEAASRPLAAARPAQRPGASGPTGARTLVELLRTRAETAPEVIHIHLSAGREEEVPITYGALWSAAASVAAGLAQRGLPAGAPVALVFPTSREFFEAFFGVMMAGGVPVPLYPPHRADQIEEYAQRQASILTAAEARMLLASESTERIARVLRSRVRSLLGAWRLDEVRSPGASCCIQVREEHLAFLQYTSGSTGTPKGVMLTHANVMANLRAMSLGLRLTPDDVCVSWLPLYHDMGLIGTWLGALYGGFPTHIASPLWFLERPERWLRAIHRHRATITAAPNFAYNLCAYKLADRALEGLDLSSWRVAINGAEPIHP
ncbi:MAG: AMP-binding protein, partial [Planctomycetota bacterium]